MNFEEMGEAFLRELKARRRSPLTVKGERSRLQRFIEFARLQGLNQLAEVTTEHLVAYRTHLAQQHSAHTGYLYLGAVRRWLGWAHHRDHILSNPAASWSPAAPSSRLRWVPTEQQMAQVLQSQPEGGVGRFLLDFLYGTGLRVQECAQLNLDDLDLEQRQLRVRLGKNNKPRVLPLGPRLCDQARHYVENLRPSTTELALFINERGTRMQAETISKWTRRAGLACQLRRFSVHTIRHAFATHLLQNGAPLAAVKQLLGHSSYRSTQLYTHLTIQDVEAALKASHPRGRRNRRAPSPSDTLSE